MIIENQNIESNDQTKIWPRISISQKRKICDEACLANGLNKSRATQIVRSKLLENNLQRDYCNLIVMVVAEKFSVPIHMIICKTRAVAKAALARQIAVYLAHTTLSVTYSAAAEFFQRDRTTIAHACRLVEDLRDDEQFDLKLSNIETLVVQTASQLHGFEAPEQTMEFSQ